MPSSLPLPSPPSASTSLSQTSEDQFNEHTIEPVIPHNQIDLSQREDEMLTALKDRRTDEAWHSLEFLLSNGHTPSSVCLSRLVAQLSYKGTPSSLSKAQTLVAILQKKRSVSLLDCDSLGLLAMASAKSGAAQYAYTIVKLMFKLGLNPHVKAWSAVVSKLGKHKEDVPFALTLFEDVCKRVKEAEAKTSDCQDIEETSENDRGYSPTMRPDTGAFNAVLNACANASLAEKASELFHELYEFGLRPDVLTFNIMIKLYAMSENREKLATILDQMAQAGVKPCLSTMHSLVAAYIGLDDLERAEMLVKALKEGRGDIRSILSSEIEDANNHMSKSSVETLDLAIGETVESVEAAHSASPGYEEDKSAALKLNFRPDTRMYTILMKGYMQKGRLNDVMRTLAAMENQEDIESHPNEVTYTTAISACVRLGFLDEARSLLLEMSARKVPANVVTYNVLLHGYCKATQIPKARVLMADMRKAGIHPDVVSYNTLVDGYISIDDNASALALFTEMRDAGIAPSNVSYTTLMKAFARSNQPELAAKVFEEMEQDGRIKVDVIAWNILIECYSNAGLVKNAMMSFERMKAHGHEPRVATYGSLVKAFAAAGKPGEALVLWKEIQERLEAKNYRATSFKPDPGLLDALVDICVRAGFFQKALEIVACMEKHQIPADKIKYKRMFVELHSRLYTSKHASQARRDRTAERRRAVEAFKFWVGLPNKYYESNWSP